MAYIKQATSIFKQITLLFTKCCSNEPHSVPIQLGRFLHICVSKIGHHLNEWWVIVNWTYRIKLHRIVNRKPIITFQEKVFEFFSAKWRQFCSSLNVLTPPTATYPVEWPSSHIFTLNTQQLCSSGNEHFRTLQQTEWVTVERIENTQHHFNWEPAKERFTSLNVKNCDYAKVSICINDISLCL